MRDRTDRAHMLMSELDGISDIYLDEALSYKPRRRSHFPVLIAACITLSLLMILGVFGAMNVIFTDKSNNDAAPVRVGLDSVLCEAVESGSLRRTDSNELPLGDGRAYLVVQLKGQDEYYISEGLTPLQKNSLRLYIGCGSDVGSVSPEFECDIWVILGDGQVMSPYLKRTKGNCGVDMFEYSAEIYPTDEFTAIVSEILQ